ncbi:MAG: cation:proton antiporter [Haliscomenobacter sp.]|nr:cation:proton antiporter [Haliscomenobacter sp.]
MFILTIVVLCFTIAWASHAVGLSLALGAFAAGLAVSGPDYSRRQPAWSSPFRRYLRAFSLFPSDYWPTYRSSGSIWERLSA